MRACGFTVKDLAYIFDVCPATIQKWKDKHPEFAQAIDEGTRVTKNHLVSQALRSAMGYDYKERTKKKTKNTNGEVIKTDYIETDKHIPGNDRMLVFLLCNIDRQLGDGDWRSIKQIEVKRDNNVNIQIDGEAAADKIKKLAGKLFVESINEPERKQVESKEIKVHTQSGDC